VRFSGYSVAKTSRLRLLGRRRFGRGWRRAVLEVAHVASFVGIVPFDKMVIYTAVGAAVDLGRSSGTLLVNAAKTTFPSRSQLWLLGLGALFIAVVPPSPTV